MIKNENLKKVNTFGFYVVKFQNFRGEKNHRNYHSFIQNIGKQAFQILNDMSKSLIYSYRQTQNLKSSFLFILLFLKLFKYLLFFFGDLNCFIKLLLLFGPLSFTPSPLSSKLSLLLWISVFWLFYWPLFFNIGF